MIHKTTHFGYSLPNTLLGRSSKLLTFLFKSLQICSILTFREAHHLLEELVVGVDNDGEGGDEVEQ